MPFSPISDEAAAYYIFVLRSPLKGPFMAQHGVRERRAKSGAPLNFTFGIEGNINLVSEIKQSSFVTALSWVFIVLAGFSTFISIAQNVMIGFMFNPSQFNHISNAPGAEAMPAFFKFMVSNVRFFFLAILIVSSTTLISSIGLLKRKNWARIIFMFIMGIGIAWVIFGVIMQFTMFPQMMHDIPDTIEIERFKMMFTIMRVFTIVFATTFCILFGWIIKKLSSQSIKREFLT